MYFLVTNKHFERSVASALSLYIQQVAGGIFTLITLKNYSSHKNNSADEMSLSRCASAMSGV